MQDIVPEGSRQTCGAGGRCKVNGKTAVMGQK